MARTGRMPSHSSFIVQLIRPETERDEEDERLDTGALQELTHRVRPEIYEALVEGFGDDSMLFASLWRTVHQESLEETLNEVTFDKAEAFSWICQGMYQLR